DHRAAANDAARVEDTVAADLGAVAHQRGELAQPGVPGPAFDFDGHVAGKRPDIGEDHAGPQMRLAAENGIAYVIEMRRHSLVEEQGVLDFARVAHDA